MALEAHVQTRFPFLGKLRVPGDIIGAEELAQTSPQIRDALVAQHHIVLRTEGAPAGDGERIDHIQARLDRQNVKLTAAEAKAARADQKSAALEKAVRAQQTEIRELKAALPAAVEAAVRLALKSVGAAEAAPSKRRVRA